MVMVPPSPPSKIHPGSLPSSAICPHPLTLPLFPPLCPFLFIRPSTSSSIWSPVVSTEEVSHLRLTADQCHAPGFLSSVLLYESSPSPDLCGW